MNRSGQRWDSAWHCGLRSGYSGYSGYSGCSGYSRLAPIRLAPPMCTCGNNPRMRVLTPCRRKRTLRPRSETHRRRTAMKTTDLSLLSARARVSTPGR